MDSEAAMLRARLASRFSVARGSTPVTSDAAADEEPILAAGAVVETDTAGTSRRALMKQGLWIMAGAAGVGLAGTGVAAGTRLPSSAAPAGAVHVAAATPTHLLLFVRDIRFAGRSSRAGARSGTRTDSASSVAPHGQLQDSAGSHVGSFSGGTLPGSDGHIAFQRFTLADGTLIGMGSGRLDDEEYAVVGGTGRYAGAAGSYRTQIRPGAHGRDAEFAIDVTGTKG